METDYRQRRFVRLLAIGILSFVVSTGSLHVQTARAQVPLLEQTEGQTSPAESSYKLVAVSIVSAQLGEETADAKPEYALAGKEVQLFAVVELVGPANDGQSCYYTQAQSVRTGRRRVPSSQLRSPDLLPAGLVELKWYKLEPSKDSYGSRNEPLEWARTSWGGGWERSADVHPTVFPDQFKSVPSGLGVMRFQVEASLAGQTAVVSSPGLLEDSRLGLSKKAAKVTFIPDMEGWLGHLFALVNTPYIWGNLAHHADEQWGSDCADFIVAAWRRYGKKVKYTNSYGMRGGEYSRKSEAIKIGSVDDESFYLNERGGRISFGPAGVTLGDIVFWPRHVGVLLKDACIDNRSTLFSPCPGNGFLDESDLVLHTLFKPPTVEGIDDAYGTPEEILRPRW